MRSATRSSAPPTKGKKIWCPLSADGTGAPKLRSMRIAALQGASDKSSDMNAECAPGVNGAGLWGEASTSLSTGREEGQGTRRRSGEREAVLESSSVAKEVRGTVLIVPETGRALRRAKARKVLRIGSEEESSAAETFITEEVRSVSRRRRAPWTSSACSDGVEESDASSGTEGRRDLCTREMGAGFSPPRRSMNVNSAGRDSRRR